jgi:hypothetical protein
MSDEVARELHMRYARGESLTAEERAILEEWYAKDERENRIIIPRRDLSAELEKERATLAALVAELQKAAQQIQEKIEQNDALRREVEELKQQLVQRRMAQPA